MQKNLIGSSDAVIYLFPMHYHPKNIYFNFCFCAPILFSVNDLTPRHSSFLITMTYMNLLGPFVSMYLSHFLNNSLWGDNAVILSLCLCAFGFSCVVINVIKVM